MSQFKSSFDKLTKFAFCQIASILCRSVNIPKNWSSFLFSYSEAHSKLNSLASINYASFLKRCPRLAVFVSLVYKCKPRSLPACRSLLLVEIPKKYIDIVCASIAFCQCPTNSFLSNLNLKDKAGLIASQMPTKWKFALNYSNNSRRESLSWLRGRTFDLILFIFLYRSKLTSVFCRWKSIELEFLEFNFIAFCKLKFISTLCFLCRSRF